MRAAPIRQTPDPFALDGGEPIPLTLRRHPRAKRLTLRIAPGRREVVVTVPKRASRKEALAFAAAHATCIREKLRHVAPGVPFAPGARIPLRGEVHLVQHMGRKGLPVVQPACTADGERLLRINGPGTEIAGRLLRWLKEEARMDLGRRVTAHAGTLGTAAPGRIAVRDPRTRWGSCSATGTLSFSWRLVMAPPAVLDYVAAHEVAHLVEMNHGPRFWALVERLAPGMASAKQWLKEEGPGLYRYHVILATDSRRGGV